MRISAGAYTIQHKVVKHTRRAKVSTIECSCASQAPASVGLVDRIGVGTLLSRLRIRIHGISTVKSDDFPQAPDLQETRAQLPFVYMISNESPFQGCVRAEARGNQRGHQEGAYRESVVDPLDGDCRIREGLRHRQTPSPSLPRR